MALRRIIVRLQGGLGNQLFQASCGLVLGSPATGVLGVQLANYHAEAERAYLLSCFTQPIEVVKREELKKILANEREIKNGAKSSARLSWGGHWRRWKILGEGDDLSARRLMNAQGLYLEGYWQDAQLVNRLEKELRAAWIFRPECVVSVQSVAEQIRSQNAIAIHVRRGDFRQDQSIHELNAPYYQQALAWLKQPETQAVCYVFSDEIEWAEKMMKWPSGTQFIRGHAGREAHLDLFLMSQARHHIIANSTFSWWGAWLAHATEGGSVVLPSLPESKIFHERAFPHAKVQALKIEESS